MTVLVSRISARFGNLRYDTHVTSLVADLALLPGINSVTARLPAPVEVSAGPGDPAEIKVANGEGAETILTGTVQSVAGSLRGREIVAGDAGAALAALRPAQSFQAKTPGDIISALAADAGLQARSLLPPVDVLPIYVADQRRTGAEHVARLALYAGGIARAQSDGQLEIAARPVGPPGMALLFGREILEIETSSLAAASDVAFIGSGGAGSGHDPRALGQTATALDGGADAPSSVNVWRPAEALRSPLLVKAATKEARAASAARGRRMRAVCWLLPALRPGDLIEIQSLPGQVDGGPWLLTHVRHEIDRPCGGATWIEAVSGDAGALLGALAGALGALL